MLLAIDIGNSSIKFGLFDRDSLVFRAAVPTGAVKTAGRTGDLPEGLEGRDFEAVIISSVVPEVNDFFAETFGVPPVFVDHTFDFSLTIKYDPPAAVGIDRLVAASAAANKYGEPCIICDFGTATTIDTVNSGGEYLGGVITPGITTLSRALFTNTAKLPEVPVRKPEKVIGNSTVGSIESGVFYGYLGLVEGILTRMKTELAENAKVIATGGFVNLMAENIPQIDIVDENLVLKGLQIIYSRTPKAG